MGWTRLTSRLMLGSVAALFFGLLPLSAPGLAIMILAEQKVCDTARGDDCLIFGGTIDRAYAAVRMGQPPFFETVALQAFGMFVLYAIVVIVLGVIRQRIRSNPESKGLDPNLR